MLDDVATIKDAWDVWIGLLESDEPRDTSD